MDQRLPDGAPIEQQPSRRCAIDLARAGPGAPGGRLIVGELHLDNPAPRARRDANAVGAMYGQSAFGLEPKGQF